MTPFQALSSINAHNKFDSGVGFAGGLSLYDEVTIPEGKFAFAFIADAEIGSAVGVTIAIYNKFLPQLRLEISGTTQVLDPGGLPGYIFLRGGDTLRRSYYSNDGSAFATMTYLVYLFND